MNEAIETAVEYLNATRIDRKHWRYAASELNGKEFKVDAFDLEKLGQWLMDGVSQAYSLWCSDTDSVEV